MSDEHIRREVLDTAKSFCITAPAGSGKTSLLTQRILALLPTVERPEQVLAIKPQKTHLTLGVVGAYPAGSRYAYEVRAFYSSGGITVEDPVTGSLHASMAQWLIGAGRFVPPYLASQGIAMGHAGEVHVSMDESKQVWIGGEVTACIQGTVEI